MDEREREIRKRIPERSGWAYGKDIEYLLSLLDAERKRVRELEGALRKAMPYVKNWMQADEDGWIEKKMYLIAEAESLLNKEQK